MRAIQKMVTIFLFIPYLVSCFGCTMGTSNVQEEPPLFPQESIQERVLPNPKIGKADEFWDVSDIDISHVSHSRKLIALTFDDSPASTLQEIVGVYLRFNVEHPDAPASATLFCNGRNVTERTLPDLEMAYAVGFEFGNHTQNHKNLSVLSKSETKREIDLTDRILQKIDGKERHLLRTPYGSMNDSIRKVSRAPIVNWFVDTLDWTKISAENIYNEVWTKKNSGVIVLMHDGYHNTVSALKRLLPDLYDAGYQVVSVSQMAKAHGCNLRNGSVYTRARKQ